MKRLPFITALFVFACAPETIAPPTTPPPDVMPETQPVDPNPLPTVAEPCADELEQFEQTIWIPILSIECAGCHTTNGVARNSRLQLSLEGDAEALRANFDAAGGAASIDVDGTPLLLAKPSGLHPNGHVGGLLIEPDSPAFSVMTHFARIATDETCNVELPPGPDCESPEPSPRLIRRLTHRAYDRTLEALFAMSSTAGARFVRDTLVEGFDTDAGALVVSPLLADQYRSNAEAIAERAVGALSRYLPCRFDEGRSCLEALIANFGYYAFRRPMQQHEIDRYLTIFDAAAVFGTDEGLKWLLVGMLQSPHFLYRTEMGERGDDGLYRLTNDEIASAMSYFLTGGPPDDELRRSVLLLPERRAVQARRLLEEPAARTAMTRFFEQWLEVTQIETVDKDPATFPTMTEEVRESMKKELGYFVEQVMGTSSGTFTELLTADYTYVDSRLETFYGVVGEGRANADGFRVTYAPQAVHGLLTQGSLLTVHASSAETSIVNRGKLIRERFFCQKLQPPPPGLDVDAPAVDPNLSTRERFAVHSENEACRGCHRLVDPIGFAFEHYDGVGRYRQNDRGHAIDARGEIVDTRFTNTSFEGVEELAQVLADSPDVHACLSEQWLRYGFGLAPDSDELACTIVATTKALQRSNLDLRALLVELVKSRHFEVRRAQD